MPDTLETPTWRASWTAESPIAIDFAFSSVDDAWQDGGPGFSCRDLGLARASGGHIGARHRRLIDKAAAKDASWLCNDADFQFSYVLKGSVTIETDREERAGLDAGSVWIRGPFRAHAETEMTDDFEVIDIQAPAAGTPFAGMDPALTPEQRALARASDGVFLHESDDCFVVGAGPRRYFAYRDLKAAEHTDRRIFIHVVRALEPMPGGTGWHTHTMSQLFVVLHGWADVAVEGHGIRRMTPGDAMCLRAGMKHDVPEFSGDYKVLEMCVPAGYETTAADAPDG